MTQNDSEPQRGPPDSTTPAAAGFGPEARALLDEMFEGLQVIDVGWRYVYVNRTAARHGRMSPDQLIGRTMMEAYPGIERTPMFRALERCMRERTPQQLINEFAYPDASRAWFDLRVTPVPQGILVLSVDVSERMAAEEQLRLSHEHLATTLDCMVDAVVTTDAEGRITRFNPAAEQLTGWTPADALGRPLDDLVRFLNRKTGAPVEHVVDRVLAGGLRIELASDTDLVTRDGTRLPVGSTGAPIRTPDGTVDGVVMVLRNMTEEQELTAMLHQAQKMEAIGRLAGGVAHDFNNLITVIAGYCDLIMADLAEDAPLRPDIQEIADAGERAATLTRQLLAFSRRQVLKPEVLDVNHVIGRMENMVRRLIGEDVDFVAKLEPSVDPVTFDPGQIEQIVMNLVVNARDAMPGGGKLTLETANVSLDDDYVAMHPGAHAGPHVMIAVSDTGVGMDAETRARIFEPFFTTKEQGKGTGLGLATMFGIVKQSGGNVWVYSEPGRGTTFKVYLPRSEDAAAPTAPARPSPPPVRHRGTGTVLVAEDEDPVRGFVTRVLEGAGYTVLQAGDAADAVALAEAHDGPIQLLLTDVVLPGMSGRELAVQVLAVRPDVRVGYMSGYTDDAIVHHGVLDPGTAFIEKPFTATSLLEWLAEWLA